MRDRYCEIERQKQQGRLESEALERKREERERRRAHIGGLIASGVATARTKTIWWAPDEREAARRAVRDELEAKVDWGWTKAEVEELVTELLDRWDDDEEDSDDAGDDEDEQDWHG